MKSVSMFVCRAFIAPRNGPWSPPEVLVGKRRAVCATLHLPPTTYKGRSHTSAGQVNPIAETLPVMGNGLLCCKLRDGTA